MVESSETPFSEVLRAFKDTSSPFPARYLRSFSDLSRTQLKDLQETWASVSENRKVSLLEDLEQVLESDTLVNFDNLARMVLFDPSSSVRVSALRLLWECEETSFIPELLNFSTRDEDEAVRAVAASLLGNFLLLGELERIDESTKRNIETGLLNIVRGSDASRVRQRALESLGYSSHADVPVLIETAFHSTDNDWIICAICAMGRSADEAWAPQIEKMILSREPEIQFEAIRAAGDLELITARDTLLSLLDEGIDDEETRLAAIWSLSQIGGEEVKEKLNELLTSAEDDEEIEWIERAIENLDFSTSDALEMYNFAPRNQDDLDDEENDNLDSDEDYDYYDEDTEEDYEDEDDEDE